MAPSLERFLNLGCGGRFLPGWTNVDFAAHSPGVLAHDLRKPLPFGDGSFDAVYHSHVLEHLSRAEGLGFVCECRRVLRPGGIIRVVVPDLEAKARMYLEKLEGAAGGGPADEHEWMVVETIDQMVRTRPGGDMLGFMASGRAAAFVRGRIGDEYDKAREAPQASPGAQASGRSLRASLKRRLRGVLGISEDEMAELEFRRLGELHRWMYDRISLAGLLRSAGFSDVRAESAGESRIPGWSGGGDFLDLADGRSRKPDSLYMEAARP